MAPLAQRLRWQWRRVARPVRRLAMRHLYQDNNHQLENNILVAGTARSGTTWLGDIVAGEHGRVLFEPFHAHKIAALHGFAYFPYLRPQDDCPALAAYAQQLFSGTVRHPWIDREVTNLRPMFRVIKEIRANLFLKWLSVHFPQVPQLFIVRHPCAVVLSRLQLQWATDSDIASFLHQPQLMADFLAPYAEIIKEAHTAVEKHTIIWCVSNLVPLRQFTTGELNLVFYEDLCLHPTRELERIAKVTKRPLPAQTSASLSKPSPTTIRSSAVLTGDSRVTQWQSLLSKEQIERIFTIVAAFGLDYLYGSSALPLADQASNE